MCKCRLHLVILTIFVVIWTPVECLSWRVFHSEWMKMYIWRNYSAICCFRADPLSYATEWVTCTSRFFYFIFYLIPVEVVYSALFGCDIWLVPRETAAVLANTLYIYKEGLFHELDFELHVGRMLINEEQNKGDSFDNIPTLTCRSCLWHQTQTNKQKKWQHSRLFLLLSNVSKQDEQSNE